MKRPAERAPVQQATQPAGESLARGSPPTPAGAPNVGPELEIERKFLLDRLPEIPRGAQVWRIEQGYLSPQAVEPGQLADEFSYGRLRRVRSDDGSVSHTHTVKSGSGLVRRQRERTITPETFERYWPRTAGRRIVKTRHRVREGDHTWEIDTIENLKLVLAEVELPSAEAQASPPSWLRRHIVREVTDDPAYTNAALAQGRASSH